MDIAYEFAMVLKNVSIFVIGFVFGILFLAHIVTYRLLSVRIKSSKRLTEAYAIKLENFLVTNFKSYAESFLFIFSLVFMTKRGKRVFYHNEKRDKLFYGIIAIAVLLGILLSANWVFSIAKP